MKYRIELTRYIYIDANSEEEVIAKLEEMDADGTLPTQDLDAISIDKADDSDISIVLNDEETIEVDLATTRRH